MFRLLARKVFGTKNERELKRIQPLVVQINALESRITPLTDAELAAQTGRFRERIANGEPLDTVLPEAFAVVREAAWRTLHMRHFDVQLIGGIVLHEGKIAEMKTGEGKTLAATLPVYLNALTGRGVHVVTVNDYLARRDAAWMGQLYHFLGCRVGVIVHGLSEVERAAAYRADCTYGTNNEFGFDYLRDNMKFDLAHYVQRELHFAIVDEVDSILIDEARTPLIISGPAERSTQLYAQVNQIMPFLQRDTHFTVDEKSKTVSLNEDGVKQCEKRLNIDNLYDPRHISYLHHALQAIRAHALYKRDVDYVVRDGEVVIVDEFTGRLMPGRRWSDGLHQAVEAKEGVRVENENQTLATITFQNFFRMYHKLAGMTGTADTEAEEFAKIYNLDVLVIPTNQPMVRQDRHDQIFKTHEAKFRAVVNEIVERHATGQPVLVGTISIERSEQLAQLLKRRGVPHHVLNAKHHEREAEIVAQAGRKGAVTISTNMAGRGTDIMLGGNPEALARARVGHTASDEEYVSALAQYREVSQEEREAVVAAGGLYILGTERHESRRIDNQLRGRSGRQGDPGRSCFFLSLEDDLLRIFGGDRIKKMMDRFGMEEDEVIEHPWLNRAIENAQRRVEGHNFSIRKNLLEYDDVMNQQRQHIYRQRRAILGESDVRPMVLDQCERVIGEIVDEYLPEKTFDPPTMDVQPLIERVRQQCQVAFAFDQLPPTAWTRDGVGAHIFQAVEALYQRQIDRYGKDLFGRVEKYLLLSTLDAVWKDHLLQMDHLKEGINLQGYAQKDPLVEYKREGFFLFERALYHFAADVLEKILRVEIRTPEAAQVRTETMGGRSVEMTHRPVNVFAQGAAPATMARVPAAVGGTPSIPMQGSSPAVSRQIAPKVGRNEPCPCGSGKKYKKCCGG
ncbi:MAG: preprotein translocase subunit SecA [Deltaproteobacteria bacterium]|nr:preprotein translocase subunit SecA [Deltaproteobacteria bacterium]